MSLSSAAKSAVSRSSPPAVSVVLAIEPVTPMPIFSPFISATGTMLIRVRKSEDSCTRFIRVCVTDGSTVNFLFMSPVSTPFSSARRDIKALNLKRVFWRICAPVLFSYRVVVQAMPVSSRSARRISGRCRLPPDDG
ncbi:hypothetical protein G184_gp22 [Erwinia phage ENT90]|uniref:Uncharacterized protein n=1 Tax=Erwinia phage ENT90 TaxID=947843 RepID=F1BUR0_9CAUD|nr:hypothetical protein G184_gp22 [Erwinia phage ENT90]ADX32442.1 hypothetical protein [Erwinia phage ENT90]